MVVSLSNRVPALTLTEFKSILRITSSAQDTYLTNLIEAATEQALEYTGKYFGTVDVKVEAEWDSVFTLPLPRPVVSLGTILIDGVEAVEDTDYTVKDFKRKIEFLTQGEEIEINFSAGYSSNVPKDALDAIGQKARRAYDMPDDQLARGSRYFENTLFRHRESETFV